LEAVAAAIELRVGEDGLDHALNLTAPDRPALTLSNSHDASR
jgi:hypothetical protein